MSVGQMRALLQYTLIVYIMNQNIQHICIYLLSMYSDYACFSGYLMKKIRHWICTLWWPFYCPCIMNIYASTHMFSSYVYQCLIIWSSAKLSVIEVVDYITLATIPVTMALIVFQESWCIFIINFHGFIGTCNTLCEPYTRISAY